MLRSQRSLQIHVRIYPNYRHILTTDGRNIFSSHFIGLSYLIVKSSALDDKCPDVIPR